MLLLLIHLLLLLLLQGIVLLVRVGIPLLLVLQVLLLSVPGRTVGVPLLIGAWVALAIGRPRIRGSL